MRSACVSAQLLPFRLDRACHSRLLSFSVPAALGLPVDALKEAIQVRYTRRLARCGGQVPWKTVSVEVAPVRMDMVAL